MFTLTTNSSAKIIIKKSSFIAAALPITKENVTKTIKQFKENNKASHHPYAYRITTVEKNKVVTEEKYNDDGEPSKTAGFPLLNIIKTQELTNCIIIVARIFGGIKLGPAGLIKAFGKAGKTALEQNNIITYTPTSTTTITIPLKELQPLEQQLQKNTITYKKTFSGTQVQLDIQLPLDKKELLKKI